MTQELTPFAKGFLEGCDARGMSFDEMQKTAEHASRNIPGVSEELACIGHMTKSALPLVTGIGKQLARLIPSLARGTAKTTAKNTAGSLSRNLARSSDDAAPGIFRKLFSNPSTVPLNQATGKPLKIPRLLSNIPGARSPATRPFTGGAGGYLAGGGIDYAVNTVSDGLDLGEGGKGYDPGLRNILGLYGAGRGMVPRNISSSMRRVPLGVESQPLLRRLPTRPSAIPGIQEFGIGPAARNKLLLGGLTAEGALSLGAAQNANAAKDEQSAMTDLAINDAMQVRQQLQDAQGTTDVANPAVNTDSPAIPMPEPPRSEDSTPAIPMPGPPQSEDATPAIPMPSPPTNSEDANWWDSAQETGEGWVDSAQDTGGRWWESLKGKFDSLGTKGQFLLALGGMGVLGGGVMAGSGRSGLGLGSSALGGLLIADLLGAFGSPGQYTNLISDKLGFGNIVGSTAPASTAPADSTPPADSTAPAPTAPAESAEAPAGDSPDAPAPAEEAAPAAGPATAASMFTDNVIDSDESSKILNTPALRAEVLNMPPQQGVAILQSAIKSDPALKAQIKSMKKNSRDDVMKVLTAEKGVGNVPFLFGAVTKDGQGLSKAEAEKFYALAKQVRV